jgi:hypothetical protein
MLMKSTARAALGAMTLVAFAELDAARPQSSPGIPRIAACGAAGTFVGIGKTTCRNAGTTIQTGAADATWSVRKPNVAAPGGAQCAVNSHWLLPQGDGGGGWVTPVGTGATSRGLFTYTLTFELPAAPSSYDGIVVGGVFSADNRGVVRLNPAVNPNPELASCPEPYKTRGTCHEIRVNYGTSDASLLRAGANTLEFEVENVSQGTTGLYATFFISAMCPAEKDPKK